MKQLAVAILVVTAVAVSAVLALNRPGAEASPDPTITVNGTGDTNTRDDFLTLREAIMLATGDLTLADLTLFECTHVSGASWDFPVGPCKATYPPGEASADTIVFDTGLFAPSSPATVALDHIISQALPALDTGDDTVDGSAAGVIVEGLGTDHVNCFEITSSNNTIKGLEIHNCRSGIELSGPGGNNTIGGRTDGERNVIYGNHAGVSILAVSGNVVMGNYIGTNADGDAAIPNERGIFINGGGEHIIGGNSDAERNVISGNSPQGMFITSSDNNVIAGNYIGTNASGNGAIPNETGVYLVAADNNTIGGTGAGQGNLIAHNTHDGVLVEHNATGNAIRRNSIHSNGGKGIKNTDGGNEELPPPTITGFGSVIGTACPGCTIDVYSDDEDEGEVYEGSTTADGDGDWSFSGSLEGPNVTATATDADGNTSEFSAPVAVPEPTPSPTPEATRTLDWGAGWQNVTWSADSTPEEAFACAAGDYAAAYRLVGGGWERYFPDRPELSNMTDLEQYDTFLILITDDVTCEMSVADAPGTERTLDWGVGWQNDGWSGADGMPPEDAFECAEGSFAAAYRLVGGGWERYFPDRPDLSNMGELEQYDAFLILVTAPVSCTMAIAP